MSKVSNEELQKSIEYINGLSLEKSNESMDFSEKTNGGTEENITRLQGELNDHVKKAKEIKEELDKLSKGEKEKPLENKEKEGKEDDDKEEVKEKKEEKPDMDKEEIMKSIKDSLFNDFNDLLKSKDDKIEILSKKIEEISNEPIRKSIIGNPTNFIERFQKSKSEGKNAILKSNKSTISNYMYDLFLEEKDDIMKGKIGEAITTFESASELDPEVRRRVQERFNLDIID